MPLRIEDDATTALVAQLAGMTGTTASEAVQWAVTAERVRLTSTKPLRERLAELRARHPLPPSTVKAADKVFFDELSGE